MSYTLQFGQVVGYIPDLLRGALISLELAFLGFVLGFAIGAVQRVGAGISVAAG